MKTNKTIELMNFAKELGYTHVAACVKSVFNTQYFNVNSIDSVISAGKWIGAPRNFNWNGRRIGTIDSAIDWSTTITREHLRQKFEKCTISK
jgi:hypothetical protein